MTKWFFVLLIIACLTSGLFLNINNVKNWVKLILKHPNINNGVIKAVLRMTIGNECLEFIWPNKTKGDRWGCILMSC